MLQLANGDLVEANPPIWGIDIKVTNPNHHYIDGLEYPDLGRKSRLWPSEYTNLGGHKLLFLTKSGYSSGYSEPGDKLEYSCII